MKGGDHVNDLLALGKEIIGLVTAHELEAAAARVRDAERLHFQISAETRTRQVAEINWVLHAAKNVCERLTSAANGLPPHEKFFAEAQIKQVIERHLTAEMNELRKRKRELSKPR